MRTTKFSNENRQKFIQVLLVVVLLLFIFLIKDYIVSLILAIVFTGLLYPIYLWFLKIFKQRKTLSSVATIVLFLLLIVVPSVLLLWEIIDQASYVSKQLFPLIEEQINTPSVKKLKLPKWLPFNNLLEPYTEQLLAKISELVSSISGMIIGGLSNFTQGTFMFFLNAFVMLYAMYYFLISGKSILKKAHGYLPLTHEEFKILTQQVTSISRATIKGAFFIGIIQGILVGFGFWVTGIPGAVFWGAIAALTSIIPSIGTSIVYLPAALYLITTGHITYGIGLLVWGFGVVSSVDNFLRPVLVGKDTQIPDVLILVTTLGGIGMFGVAGIILGPIIAGLVISVSKIHRDFLLKFKNEHPM